MGNGVSGGEVLWSLSFELELKYTHTHTKPMGLIAPRTMLEKTWECGGGEEEKAGKNSKTSESIKPGGRTAPCSLGTQKSDWTTAGCIEFGLWAGR